VLSQAYTSGPMHMHLSVLWFPAVRIPASLLVLPTNKPYAMTKLQVLTNTDRCVHSTQHVIIVRSDSIAPLHPQIKCLKGPTTPIKARWAFSLYMALPSPHHTHTWTWPTHQLWCLSFHAVQQPHILDISTYCYTQLCGCVWHICPSSPTAISIINPMPG